MTDARLQRMRQELAAMSVSGQQPVPGQSADIPAPIRAMLDAVPVSTRLQFAALMQAAHSLRSNVFAVAMGTQAPVATNALHTMMQNLPQSTRVQFAGLLLAPDAIRDKLASLMQASVLTSAAVPVPAPTPAAVPVRVSANDNTAVPQQRINASMLQAALQQVQSTPVISSATEKQVFAQFTVRGAWLGAPIPASQVSDHARTEVPPSDAVMARVMEAALRETLPHFKDFLETEWVVTYPRTTFEVMTFHARGDAADTETLLLNMLAAVDPKETQASVEHMMLDFTGHLLQMLQLQTGCIDTAEVEGRTVYLIAAAMPQSIRVGPMGTLHMP